jgi:hypothetical protein
MKSSKSYKQISWEESRDNKPEECLTKGELEKYNNALADFTKRLSNTKPKTIKEIFSIGIGLTAFRYARQWADPHKSGNLYKKIYQLVFYYDYKKELQKKDIRTPR